MQELEAKEFLEEAFRQAANAPGMETARQKYGKLKMRSASRTAASNGNLYQKARTVMTGKAGVIAAETDSRLVLLTGSGFGQRNPAMVELEFSDTEVTATAWAKEGLIPQKSAPSAVDAIFAELGLL